MLQFAGTDAVPTPASPQAVAALPSVEYRHDVVAGDDCFVLDDGEVRGGRAAKALRYSICLDPLRDATLLRMPCARNHIFHKIYLLAWLETKNSCPVCRRLPTEADETEERKRRPNARRRGAGRAAAAAAAAAAARPGRRGGGDEMKGGDVLPQPPARRWGAARMPIPLDGERSSGVISKCCIINGMWY